MDHQSDRGSIACPSTESAPSSPNIPMGSESPNTSMSDAPEATSSAPTSQYLNLIETPTRICFSSGNNNCTFMWEEFFSENYGFSIRRYVPDEGLKTRKFGRDGRLEINGHWPTKSPLNSDSLNLMKTVKETAITMGEDITKLDDGMVTYILNACYMLRQSQVLYAFGRLDHDAIRVFGNVGWYCALARALSVEIFLCDLATSKWHCAGYRSNWKFVLCTMHIVWPPDRVTVAATSDITNKFHFLTFTNKLFCVKPKSSSLSSAFPSKQVHSSSSSSSKTPIQKHQHGHHGHKQYASSVSYSSPIPRRSGAPIPTIDLPSSNDTLIPSISATTSNNNINISSSSSSVNPTKTDGIIDLTMTDTNSCTH